MKRTLIIYAVLLFFSSQSIATVCADGSSPQLKTVTLRDPVTGQFTYQTEQVCNDPILVSGSTTTTTNPNANLSANFSGRVAGGKQAAENQSKNMSTGKMLVYGASALAAARGIMCLPTPGPCPGQSPYWFAGAALGVLVGSQLGGGHKQRADAAALSYTDPTTTQTVNNPGVVPVVTEDVTNNQTDLESGVSGPGTDNSVAGPGSDSALQKSIQQTLNSLKQNGYKVDVKNGTMTTPDGKKVDLKKNGYNVPKALQAAGFSSSESSQITAAMNQAGEQAKAEFAKGIDKADVLAGMESTGGGGKSAPTSGNNIPADFGMGDDLQPSNPAAGTTVNPQVAGLSKNYNGEKIGIANDSLFKMIHRKYDLEESRGQFIERAPASVPSLQGP